MTVIARTAALVLHVDVIYILLPVCRGFISFLRRTPLNDFIPFDKNITFHKATAWSIVFFSFVHIAAHMVNFYKLAMADTSATNTGQRIVAFLVANFATGPGATGWIMTAALGVMVWFAIEKRRRSHFERFWYSHHLFIVFFINWQLHGMFCMIQPDRPPYCSFNTIGVFWVSDDIIINSPGVWRRQGGLTIRFLTCSATGSSVELSGSTSVFFVKSARVTGHTSRRSFSIRLKSWKSRSRRRRRPLALANTFSCAALRSLTSNGTRSLSLGMSFSSEYKLFTRPLFSAFYETVGDALLGLSISVMVMSCYVLLYRGV